MYKAIAILLLTAALAGCDAVNTLSDSLKHTRAIESDLAEKTGVKPSVGFSWNNGALTSVTVSFPKLYDEKPLRELAVLTRTAVTTEFKQTPKAIYLTFRLDAGTIAEAAPANAAN